MAKAKKDPNEMSFLDHLEELRWHLIRASVAILIAAVVVFFFKSFVFNTLIDGPRKVDFATYQFFCNLSQNLGLNDGLCVTEMPFKVQHTQMASPFSIHIWTSITLGFILAFPFVLFEIWRFIKPGLHDNERKYAGAFISIGSLLFFLGVLFGYYVIAPLSVNFLGGYSLGNDAVNNPTYSSYIAIIRSTILAGGIIFELPIIIYFLAKLGLVTPAFLRKYRKHAFVLVLIASAIITPPDIASQVIVSIPIVILYEISILVTKIVVRNQEKKALRNG
ncbi:twin-arginine translocase subunit TatC [Sungkyunkwania multivorans]|uniref:Sec-independent protein translocase protein TatC n=1 Tax=Sungkyunkwania multivorans TaxID=1173618 RepID=A0ABW3D2B4_9FLAO